MATVVGLGNAGAPYSGTRHNVGFEVVNALGRRWRLDWVEHGPVWTARGTYGGETVTLAKPQEFMNQSGESLKRIGLESEGADLLVVHDEIDLPCGTIRVKVGGGSAGHRGVASIAALYGPDFKRVRVGIGRPLPGVDVADFVLGCFTADEQKLMAQAVEVAADAVELILDQGDQAAMQRFNTRRLESPVDVENA